MTVEAENLEARVPKRSRLMQKSLEKVTSFFTDNQRAREITDHLFGKGSYDRLPLFRGSVFQYAVQSSFDSAKGLTDRFLMQWGSLGRVITGVSTLPKEDMPPGRMSFRLSNISTLDRVTAGILINSLNLIAFRGFYYFENLAACLGEDAFTIEKITEPSRKPLFKRDLLMLRDDEKIEGIVKISINMPELFKPVFPNKASFYIIGVVHKEDGKPLGILYYPAEISRDSRGGRKRTRLVDIRVRSAV